MLIDFEQEVYIPHLGIWVYLLDDDRISLGQYDAGTKRLSKNEYAMFMSLPVYIEDLPELFHELIHVLDFICLDFGIKQKEYEHRAYIGQFIISNII